MSAVLLWSVGDPILVVIYYDLDYFTVMSMTMCVQLYV